VTRAAAQGDLGGNGGRIGESQPIDSSVEVPPISIHELAGQLGFADAAQASSSRDLADGGGGTAFECSGERTQISFATDEHRVAIDRHPRAERQIHRRIWDGVERKRGEALSRFDQLGGIYRSRPDVLVDVDDRGAAAIGLRDVVAYR
jgi:hypothetical protein